MIYLMRHGQDDESYIGGWSDVSLIQKGVHEVNLTGEWIKDKTYGEIGSFWIHNKDKINSILEEMMNNDIELRDKLDDYYMNTLSFQ